MAGVRRAITTRTLGPVRAAALIIVLCVAAAGCSAPFGDSAHHSRWYRLAYMRCSRGLRRHTLSLVGPGTMVVPAGTVPHWKEWQAGCDAAARDAGYLSLRGRMP
jgi:hypothetical protein